jgi:hypothetical protein
MQACAVKGRKGIAANSAHAVFRPKRVVKTGNTTVLDADQARRTRKRPGHTPTTCLTTS